MGTWSRKELLEWVNDFLQVSVPSVQLLGTGAVYVQLMDSIFPGEVELERVDWGAETEYDSMKNLKILQTALGRHHVQHPPIDFQQVSKGNIVENLEVLRFLRGYWEANYRGDYDPVERRNDCRMQRSRSFEQRGRQGSINRGTGRTSRGLRALSNEGEPPSIAHIAPDLQEQYGQVFDQLDSEGRGTISVEYVVGLLGLSASALSGMPPNKQLCFEEFVLVMSDPNTDLNAARGTPSPHSSQLSPKPAQQPPVSPKAAPLSPKPAHQQVGANRRSAGRRDAPQRVSTGRVGGAAAAEVAKLKEEVQQLKKQVKEEMEISKELEEERDFYYQKLREVEEVCQDHQDNSPHPELLAAVFDVLWRPRPGQ